MAEGLPEEPSPTETPPSLSARRGRSWRRTVLVALVVLVIMVSTVVLLGPSGPWEEAVLATGRAFLDVPLATLYTAPPNPNATVNTSVELSYASGFWLTSNSGVPPAVINYRWSVASGTDPPVQFRMGTASVNQSQFDSGGLDSFGFYPAGGMSHAGPSYLNATVEGPGAQAAFVTRWSMDYTVRRMAVRQWFVTTNFLEVDYTLAVVDRGTVLPLPAANVSLPTPDEVAKVGRPISVTPPYPMSVSGNGYSQSPDSPFTVYEPFHHNLTSITLHAGAAGTIVAGLTATSFWSYTCSNMTQCWRSADEILTLTSSSATVWFQVYLDLRFGSVFIEYVPPPSF